MEITTYVDYSIVRFRESCKCAGGIQVVARERKFLRKGVVKQFFFHLFLQVPSQHGYEEHMVKLVRKSFMKPIGFSIRGGSDYNKTQVFVSRYFEMFKEMNEK